MTVKFTSYARGLDGQALAGKSVYVYVPATGALASLVDVNGAAAPNPLTTRGDGQFSFYIDAGTYDLLVNGEWLRGVTVSDRLTGWAITVIDEVISLAAAGAKFKATSAAVPAGAVILLVQANIDTLAVAGGTTAKLALGLHGGDVDKYGISADLLKNTKINTIPDWAVLSGTEQIDINGVLTDGSDLGDTNLSAGAVHFRCMYAQPAALPDAA